MSVYRVSLIRKRSQVQVLVTPQVAAMTTPAEVMAFVIE